jgi:competence protein ComEA
LVSISISRSTAIVCVCVVLALLALVGQRLAQTGAAQESEVVAAPLEPVAAVPPHAVLVVHVVGEVRRPGLYELRDGARRGADLAALNLAAPLVDGVQVLVPARVPSSGAVVPGGPTPMDGAAPVGPISLSSATVEELDELPGVGPITAQKIVDYRSEHGPFATVDDLDAVPGVGPTRIEQLRDLVTP